MLRLRPEWLPSKEAWLHFNRVILFLLGSVSFGIGVLAILLKRRLTIAIVLFLLVGLTGCLQGLVVHNWKLRRSLNILANSLFSVLFGYGTIDVARDGDVVGAILLTATAVGAFIIPGLAALRRRDRLGP